MTSNSRGLMAATQKMLLGSFIPSKLLSMKMLFISPIMDDVLSSSTKNDCCQDSVVDSRLRRICWQQGIMMISSEALQQPEESFLTSVSGSIAGSDELMDLMHQCLLAATAQQGRSQEFLS
ncbi:MAG: hypothetical protein FRX49_08678 [Trebouxia sp. A1-2]|nr:MAG: hypothetical protein FRX49_08678 [Trebouxia sp. A1-2]